MAHSAADTAGGFVMGFGIICVGFVVLGFGFSMAGIHTPQSIPIMIGMALIVEGIVWRVRS